MTRLVTLLMAALLAFTAFAAVVPSEMPMTKLQVKVTDIDGKVVDRASVIVSFVAGQSKVKFGKNIVTRWEVRTNQDGMVKIPLMPQGKILVQVIAKGYQTFGDTFEIKETEKTLEVKLNPPQPQYSSHQ